MERMRHQLKRQYIRILVPAAAGYVTAAVLYRTGPLPWRLGLPWARVLFVAAIGLAAGLPLCLRVLFARHAGQKPGMGLFYRFQQSVLLAGLAPAYLAVVAYACGVPVFFQAGTLLAALYGAYYFYPSSARLEADRRIFNIDSGGSR